MNTKLKTEARKEFGKDFFKVMNNAVFRKTQWKMRESKEILN